MSNQDSKPLKGDSFRESFLMDVMQLKWPNVCRFIVWSPKDSACYQITAQNVIEYHFLRIGTGKLEDVENGIPLGDIYVTRERDFKYWSERISAFAEQGYDPGDPPICIEFTSHLFANRQREMLTRDRDTGLLVVCRSMCVEEDYSYDGPRPTAHTIPSE